MRRLVLATPSPEKDARKIELKIEEVPIPVPRAGEVLIKVVAAPVNPSDYGEWFNTAPSKCPMVVGKEGCGIVVASGSITTKIWTSVGQKVGFVNLPKGQGSYSEYVTAPAATSIFPMPDDLPVETAASFFVNPYTVVGILDTCEELGAKGLVHTAAASQVGQMMVKLVKIRKDVTLINVVRREEQAATLRALGAEHVVVSSVEGWETELEALIKKYKITVAFDAIAGDMTGTLLTMLPPKGSAFVYGNLAQKPMGNIASLDLIYRKKKLNGFFLTSWLMKGGHIQMLGRLRKARLLVNPGLVGGWSSSKFVDTTLDKALEQFATMFEGGSFTDAKLRIRFDQFAEAP
eukprot:CAMPEP_0183340676 /NCGR_PEP_ID=MMETSP0164_2-20130417/7147_1 /TAXON_ID=221442 /ORGANISM="Coccolithus pelagicus ssp braarudi, Strain PLY182g" /LENGTH=347 /DNA_ID=CAMNT_0025510851 /DNA_START=95 /DNA_END=1138 /DNA_ORIENTATION=+